jgi:hypothetical protein
MGRCQSNATRRYQENYLSKSTERIHQVSVRGWKTPSHSKRRAALERSSLVCFEYERLLVLGPTAAGHSTTSTQNKYEILRIDAFKTNTTNNKWRTSRKENHSISQVVAAVAAVALLAFSLPVYASEMDSRI